jgi:hypothetical protein
MPVAILVSSRRQVWTSLVSLITSTECSAKHNRGVTEVFTEAARVSIRAEAKGASGYGAKKGGCIVM